jgi:hypothetical protein
MTGTKLKIITPAATEVLGPDVDRLAILHIQCQDGQRAAQGLAQEPSRWLGPHGARLQPCGRARPERP